LFSESKILHFLHWSFTTCNMYGNSLSLTDPPTMIPAYCLDVRDLPSTSYTISVVSAQLVASIQWYKITNCHHKCSRVLVTGKFVTSYQWAGLWGSVMEHTHWIAWFSQRFAPLPNFRRWPFHWDIVSWCGKYSQIPADRFSAFTVEETLTKVTVSKWNAAYQRFVNFWQTPPTLKSLYLRGELHCGCHIVSTYFADWLQAWHAWMWWIHNLVFCQRELSPVVQVINTQSIFKWCNARAYILWYLFFKYKLADHKWKCLGFHTENL